MSTIVQWLVNNSDHKGPISLIYHSISHSEETPEWLWEVTLTEFEKQLDLLKSENWTTICYRDLEHPETVPNKSILITFDDGYENNYAAAEALHKRGMCATWFIVSNDIGEMSSWNDPGSVPLPMLSTQQLLAMEEMGMEIGSHTMSHCKLADVSLDQAKAEIEGSKQKLTEVMGKQIDSFCYPYGSHTDAVVEFVRQADYKFACVTHNGWVNYDPDPLRIHRIVVYPYDTVKTFAFKLYLINSKLNFKGIVRSIIRRFAYPYLIKRNIKI